MYLPKHFSESDQNIINEIIHKYDFATIITKINNDIEITHIPLLLDKSGNTLVGHIARANPIYNLAKSDAIEVKIIFNGPHGYISNKYYINPDDNVPTWNYIAIHIDGKLSIVDDNEPISKILDKQFSVYESNDINWENPKISKMVNGIVGIQISIENVIAKFKLSQNKSTEDQKSIILRLSDSNPELALFMQNYLKLDN
jgi:transcriptional regulator